MRLRDPWVMFIALLVLVALAGCHKTDQITYVGKPIPNFKSDANTPHAAAQNDVALAQEYIKEGKYELALAKLQHAVKLDSSSPDAYTMLGYLNEKINRLDQAGANYEKSVKLAPNSGDILNNYGAWLCRSQHPADADQYFRRALADPFYKTPSAALGNAAACALQAGKPALAESYDRQVLALDANNADALQSLATMAYQRGDYLQARGFVERLLAASKSAPQILEFAAQIEDKLGDNDAATAYRNRLSSEFPQYAPSQH
ncbi:MAG TPA: type IV pilus biogenesis/stability protein PilW [Xanthomonadaceae bacterium]|jgi:type IV pilus assembly protein PilF|nr:type IV pilus biogenesis/stability protein PilW [Xanthomonadaceae bacterium]